MRRFIWGLGVIFLCGLAAQAQNAQLSGVVADPSGGVVPKASILLQNQDTGIKYRAESNEAGAYTFPFLKPGVYEITVEKAGFKTLNRTGINLDVGQNATVDVTLRIGAMTQRVEVTAGSPLLATQDATNGQVVSRIFTNDLPLVGRSVYDLAFLAPGVNPAPGATISSGTGGNNFISNGGRNVTSDILLDGATTTAYDAYVKDPQFEPSVDSVQEFKIQQNNFSADTGYSGGTVVNVVMRSGTNQFHGSAYDFFRNQVLDANDWFNNANNISLAPLRYNDFGGTAGGPIQKDKTFFFASYEGSRTRTLATYSAGVPSAAERQGDFGELCTYVGGTFDARGLCSIATGQLWDPYSGVFDPSVGGPVRNQFIPFDNLAQYQSPGNPKLNGTPFQPPATSGNLIDPVSSKMMQYFPLPNSGVGTPSYNRFLNWRGGGANLADANQYEFRIDRGLSDRTQANGRFAHNWSPVQRAIPFPTTLSPGFANPTTFGSTSTALNLTRNFGPATVLTVTYGFVRGGWVAKSISTLFPNFDPVKDVGLKPYMLVSGVDTTPFVFISQYAPAAGINNIGQTGWAVNNIARQSHDLLGSLTHMTGHNELKVGGQLRVLQQNNFQPGVPMGVFTFDQFGTSRYPFDGTGGDSMATMLTGTSTDGYGVIQIPLAPALTSFEYSVYFQDTWRVTNKLTLNLGLRYDLELPATERHNRLNYFDPMIPSPLQVASLPNLKGGDVFVTSKQRHWIPDPYHREFQPRFGIAYRANPHTVLRAGYGIFFNVFNFGPGFAGQGFDGFSPQTFWFTTYKNDGATPSTRLSDPWPNGGPALPTGNSLGALTNVGNSPTGPVPAWNKTPYTQTWSAGFQHELPGAVLVDANYVGTKGTNLLFGDFNNLNFLGPWVEHASSDQIAALNSRVPNPFLGIITDPSSPLSAPTVPAWQLQVPFPQFTGMVLYEPPWANSTYHAFQLRVEKRLSQGLQLLATYVISKSLDNASIQSGNTASFGGFTHHQDPNNLKLEHGLSEFDIPQVLQFTYVYQLPFGRGKHWATNSNRWLDGLLGGWQTNGIWRFDNGQPVSLSLQGGQALPTYGQRPNLLAPLRRNNGPDRMQHYFANPEVAVVPPPFTLGTAPAVLPNVRVPGTNTAALSLFKGISLNRLREGSRLEFRLESFNAFNHPQFCGPNGTIDSGSFGLVSCQANSPREVQMALKLYW